MKPVLLIEFFRQIDQIQSIEIAQYPWELLIRQARHANLLSRTGYILDHAGLLNALPQKAQQHFSSAIKIGAANQRASLWEIKDTARILGEHEIDFILLKGCAYLWLGLDASNGRLFADTDILVRKQELLSAERALVHNGWVTTKIDFYDQRYYREWTHEIPPLHHTRRHTTLDVHHDIVPPIIRTNFNIDAFWDMAVRDSQQPGLLCLQPVDMILHSATHLFHEGEFDNGLRDLVDLDSLLKQSMKNSHDWQTLIQRAIHLDLNLYLYYALNYASQLLHTPVPNEILDQSFKLANINRMMNYIMDALFLRVLIPDHASCRPKGAAVARYLLFIRSHWLKMPWYLLIPHLLRKTFKK